MKWPAEDGPGEALVQPWPATPQELMAVQQQLGAQSPPLWHPAKGVGTARPGPADAGLVPPVSPELDAESLGAVAGCFVCFPRGGGGPGSPGDPAWAAAALVVAGRIVAVAVVRGAAGASYGAGLLALREGPLLEAAVRALPCVADLLLVNATGRDHPRRAGLALHLGAQLGVPSIGITNRPLLALGGLPAEERGSGSPLRIGGEIVGCWVRTRAGTRPLAVHAAWRTDPDVAVVAVLALTRATRTPPPLRAARQGARTARARATGRAR
jgi:deoxyribonuclease V